MSIRPGSAPLDASSNREPERDTFVGWLVVVAAGLSVSLGSFDSNAATAVLPDIGRDLHADPAAVQWVVLGYLIPIAAVALSAGTWFSTAGRRPAMILLVAGFALSSVIAGFAPNIGLMIAARAVQGLFGAGLFGACMVVALQAVPRRRQPRVIATMTTSGALGGIAGPALGSLIAAYWGWPWVFAVCGPVGIVAIVVFLIGIPRGGGLPVPSARLVADGGLIGIAVTAILLSLTFGPENPTAYAFAVGAFPPLVIWWLRSRTTSIGRLLVATGVRPVLIAVVSVGVSVMGVQLAISYFSRSNAGLNVEQTGLVLAVVALATAAFAQLAVPAHHRLPPEIIGIVGCVLLTASIGSLAFVGGHWTAWDLAIRAAGVGAAQGLVQPSLSASMFGRVTGEAIPEASAAMHLVRTLGFAAGPAVVVAAWSSSGYELSGIRLGFMLATAIASVGIVAFIVAARTRIIRAR